MDPKILVTPRCATRAGHKSLDALYGARYDVIYCTPGMQPTTEELRTLLPGCVGFLSLHCRPTADGRPLLDAAALARMKPGVFIINTARFDVLDADAVLAALDSGHIAGLALDVFDTEPPTDQRMARHPRVLATPHIGAFTRESIDRAMIRAVINLLVALQGT